MADLFELQAEIRENLGKADTRRMRRIDNIMPAVIYGAGKDPQHLSIPQKDIFKALQDEAFYSSILTLHIAGKKEKAVLKALQRHPYKQTIMHADFLRISSKDKITMTVPLHFINEEIAPGIKDQNGVISHTETSAEISCLPADLPGFLEVDVSKMELDQSLHLSDIKLPKGVELVDLMHENDRPITSIHLPHVEVEEEPAVEEGEGEEKPEAKDKKDEGDSNKE